MCLVHDGFKFGTCMSHENPGVVDWKIGQARPIEMEKNGLAQWYSYCNPPLYNMANLVRHRSEEVCYTVAEE